MENDSAQEMPRVFKLLVLMAWIGTFVGLITNLSGAPPVAQLLSPDFWWLLKMGTGVLLVYFFGTYHTAPMIRRPVWGLIQAGLLLVPLLYLPLALSSQFSPLAFEKRSVAGSYTDAGPSGPLSTGPRGEKEHNGQYSLLDLASNRDQLVGTEVSTTGIVHLDERLPEDTFFCYRLLVWCCVADARPIGILVKLQGSSALKSGTWVRVQGIVEKSKFNDHEATRIQARSVEEIAPPQVQYIFQ